MFFYFIPNPSSISEIYSMEILQYRKSSTLYVVIDGGGSGKVPRAQKAVLKEFI